MQKPEEPTTESTTWFSSEPHLVEQQPCEDWDLVLEDGPVVATAVHDGHRIRESLLPYLASGEDQRRREEDPLTGLLTEVGDVRLQVRSSRFQADFNRPRDQAVSTDPDDTWGVRIWNGPLPQAELERSLAGYDRFHAMFSALIEKLLARWDYVLLLDIHSYNHRREGAEATPAPQRGNPDIELGVTTLDPARWGATAQRFMQALREIPVDGRALDVRENVRWPTGGHFPEWVYATWGERVCTISPEYKKIYMDEWTAQADIAVIEDFRRGLEHAVDTVRPEFQTCR